jgi:hypothetical protein
VRREGRLVRVARLALLSPCADSRVPDLYVPTQQERRRAASLLRRVTPSPSLYRRYRSHVDVCVMLRSIPRNVSLDGHQVDVTGFELVQSRLFNLEFLVLGVDWAAFRAARPDSDAVAASSVSEWLPPVVLLPRLGRRRLDRNVEPQYDRQCRAPTQAVTLRQIRDR